MVVNEVNLIIMLGIVDPEKVRFYVSTTNIMQRNS